jgi:hypothetical protein
MSETFFATKENSLLFFAGLWLAITTLLGLLSGWFYLRWRFTDLGRDDRGDLLGSYKYQTAGMGIGVNLRNILTLEVYRLGLRLKILRVFGIFNRPIFIPWSEIRVERKWALWGKAAVLRFGNGGVFSKLVISPNLADELWNDVGDYWPEKGPLPEPPTRFVIIKRHFVYWLFMTAIVATFFIVVPRLFMNITHQNNSNSYPPVWVAVLFPAVVFGFVYYFQCVSKIWRMNRKKKEQ